MSVKCCLFICLFLSSKRSFLLCADNSIPISCPFRNDYHLKYKNGSRDFCDEPHSEMKTCANDSKLNFRFRKCEDVPRTFDVGTLPNLRSIDFLFSPHDILTKWGQLWTNEKLMTHATLSDLDLRCLATWKDGSTKYVYGSFRGKGVVSRDDQYRCFVSTASTVTSTSHNHLNRM